jgi:hypothetical protein
MTETNESEATAGRGRLADVIASRGGKAAPEAPFVIRAPRGACPPPDALPPALWPAMGTCGSFSATGWSR